MMEPKRIFEINASKPVFIAEEVLKPTSHFTPEDKKAIAVIHAEHIQSYFNFGMNPVTQILLVTGNPYDELPGAVLNKKTPFKTESGQDIDIQTIFSPFEGLIPQSILDTCQYLSFNGHSYV